MHGSYNIKLLYILTYLRNICNVGITQQVAVNKLQMAPNCKRSRTPYTESLRIGCIVPEYCGNATSRKVRPCVGRNEEQKKIYIGQGPQTIFR
jgi:protein-arginine kinase activator protein McsA